jgi:hypothetical protein
MQFLECCGNIKNMQSIGRSDNEKVFLGANACDGFGSYLR